MDLYTGFEFFIKVGCGRDVDFLPLVLGLLLGALCCGKLLGIVTFATAGAT